MDAYRLQAHFVDEQTGNDYHGIYPVGLWEQMSEKAQEACRNVARERLRRHLMEDQIILTDRETDRIEVEVMRYQNGDLSATPERVA